MTTELQSRPIHHLPPQCSEDGRWWWDGSRWVETPHVAGWRSMSSARVLVLVVLLLIAGISALSM